MQTKRALICGVTGQDGTYLSQLLLGKGYEVVGTSRDASINTSCNLKRLGILERVKVVSMAPNDFRSVLQVLKSEAPDEIYNLSGQSSVGLSFEQPVETFQSVTLAALNLLEAMRFLKKPMRLYNACSSECFGDTGDKPADENTPFRPRSPYAVAKSAAFWQVANYRQSYGLYVCSGILFNHESPLRPERFVTQKTIRAAARIALGSKEKLNLGNTHIVRDWGWAPEYVEAMWLMLQQGEADDYVIATGDSSSLEDLVAVAFGEFNLDWRHHVVINPTLLRSTEILASRASPQKARERLGWAARNRMRAVVRMMAQECGVEVVK